MLEQSNELSAWDRDHFFHPSTHMGTHARGESPARIMAGGEGVTVWDNTGKKSIDAFAGLYCVNVGYGRQKIADAIANQARNLAYYHAYVGHGTEASITVAKMIIDRAPKGMSRVYFGLSGSDANETNIKLIWYYNNVLGRPEKKKIISRWRGYHGSGVMTGSLTGLELFHNAFDLPRAPILHTEAPYYFRRADRSMSEEQFSQHCADKLEEMILAEGPDTVAAFIGEPILGTGGIGPPPAGYWEKIQAVLTKYDVLLIADEVVTGFGRLGTMFGSDHYGIKPDLITIAKGLTSGYIPMGGVIVRDKVAKVISEGGDFNHGFTYSGHPVAAAVGLENLRILRDEQIVEKARTEAAPYLQKRLRELQDHPLVGEVRGLGMLGAIELVKDKATRSRYEGKGVGMICRTFCFENGLIMRAVGDTMIIAPPLVISHAEIDELVEKARKCLDLTLEAIR